MRNSILILLILCWPLSALAQDEISIEMHVSPDTISLDGQAFLAIVIKSSRQNMPAPELPNLTMFDVNSQGSSTNISIVNGAMEASQAYNYLLTPKMQGTFVIKPASIVYNRTRYQSQEATITVLKSGVGTPRTLEEAATEQASGANRDIFLTAELDKKSVYVGQQVTLTVKFYHSVKLLSQPDYTPPQTTDFWSDNLDPQKSYPQTVNGRRYNVIELTTALFPTRSGELNVGTATVSVMVPADNTRKRNDPFSLFDSFFDRGVTKTARTRSLTLNVLPLPTEGKPENFSGTVGDFSISSSIDKTTTEVNQPVTVTYKISGTGNIKTVAEPQIEETADFRVYQAASDEKSSKIQGKVGGTKIFEEAFIPKRAGKITIPGVSLDFFDPAAKKYKIINTKPITIEVKAAALGDYASVPVPQVTGRIIEPGAKDIRYIKTDPGQLERSRPLILFTPLYLILNGLPVVVLVLAWVSRLRQDKLSSDVGYARSRAARKMAAKRLARARKLSAGDKAAEFFGEIRQALFSYIADKKNLSPHGLTGDMILETMAASGLDTETLELAQGLLRKADFAQYSSARVPHEEMMNSLKTAEDIMVKLEGVKLG